MLLKATKFQLVIKSILRERKKKKQTFLPFKLIIHNKQLIHFTKLVLYTILYYIIAITMLGGLYYLNTMVDKKLSNENIIDVISYLFEGKIFFLFYFNNNIG